jgi:nucleoside-triphosphatase THEP1
LSAARLSEEVLNLKILLTAPPATGKSTVITAVANKFEGNRYGIIAQEMLDETAKRIGFKSVDISGKSRQFMFRTETPTEESVGGEFDVDVRAIDEFVVPELQRGLNGDGLIIVDEIGRAQAKSAMFLDVLREIFASDCNILASIVYEDEPWSLEFKSNENAVKIEVTLLNRTNLPQVLLTALSNSAAVRSLTRAQQRCLANLFTQFIANGEFIAAQKLFDNALFYVVEKQLKLKSKSNGKCVYEIKGKTHTHQIIHHLNEDKFQCDCELSNGSGTYSGNRQTCSHEATVRLANVI